MEADNNGIIEQPTLSFHFSTSSNSQNTCQHVIETQIKTTL